MFLHVLGMYPCALFRYTLLRVFFAFLKQNIYVNILWREYVFKIFHCNIVWESQSFGLIIMIYDNYAWMGYITLEQYNQGRSHSETNKAMSGEEPELLFYSISLERTSQNSVRTIYLLRKVFLVIQSQYKDLTSQWFHNIF